MYILRICLDFLVNAITFLVLSIFQPPKSYLVKSPTARWLIRSYNLDHPMEVMLWYILKKSPKTNSILCDTPYTDALFLAIIILVGSMSQAITKTTKYYDYHKSIYNIGTIKIPLLH